MIFVQITHRYIFSASFYNKIMKNEVLKNVIACATSVAHLSVLQKNIL